MNMPMMPPGGGAPQGGPVDPAMVQQILANKPLLDAIMQAIVQQAQQGDPGAAGGAQPMPPGGPQLPPPPM